MSKEREAVDLLFEMYKKYTIDEKENAEWFDAIILVKRAIERGDHNKSLRGLLLSKLVHYSEQVGRFSTDDRDEGARTVMASKQQALLEVLMEADL